MANNVLDCTCCLFILMICIGHGDGRWKKRDRENLYHEIDVFKRMAEKIEHEIEAFYEDYPDEKIKGDDIEKIQEKHVKDTLDHKTGTKNLPDRKETTHKFSYIGNITNDMEVNLKSENSAQSEPIHVSFINNKSLDTENSNWPKFEDILLEMGKRYDWKNDRWIKVKRKLKPLKKPAVSGKSSVFHEKHKFSYRTVKLNSKSRRNVVIAVSAVR